MIGFMLDVCRNVFEFGYVWKFFVVVEEDVLEVEVVLVFVVNCVRCMGGMIFMFYVIESGDY